MDTSRLRPLLLRLALELVVVFIGVYAGSTMARRDNEHAAEERRRQLQAALVQEIRDITANTRRVGTLMPTQLAQFDSALTAGKRPPLQPMLEPVRVQTHMWEATLQSGALELFDVPTVYRISEFYNELNAGFERLAQLRQLSETYLIPTLGGSSDEFYTPDNELRPKYWWYRAGLEELGSQALRITVLGDSLVAQLSRAQR